MRYLSAMIDGWKVFNRWSLVWVVNYFVLRKYITSLRNTKFEIRDYQLAIFNQIIDLSYNKNGRSSRSPA
jgi:hypothetical protein